MPFCWPRPSPSSPCPPALTTAWPRRRIGGLTLTKSADVGDGERDLFVLEDKVTVDYVFTNTSAKDIETPVAFPLPDVVNGPYIHRPDFCHGARVPDHHRR